MRGMFRNTRGAVTVIVTLLLIPALLITGTSVDLARLYTVRSVLQDGNLLAANAALASYDALLQDLYGLYAVSIADPELGRMLDEYVRVTVFGSESEDIAYESSRQGEFKLVYGAPEGDSLVRVEGGAPLSDPDVLRRQIEEYAKYRAPALIVEDLLGKVEQFTKVKNDAQAISDKLEIDDGLKNLSDIYVEFYERVRYNDYFLRDRNTSGVELDA